MPTSRAWELARVELEIEERRRRSADAGLVGHDAEFALCRADAARFIDSHLIIDDAQGDGGGTMPFRLWDDQRDALAHLRDDRLVIFLKARQLGISWLCLGYALWLMVFHPGKVVLLFSQGETEALEMLRRLKAMYERLPVWMAASLPRRTRDNTSEQGWDNGSWCKCMPATQRAGRSFTASLVVMDEAAHQQYGGKLYAALKPTIDAGGKLFVVSSANGSDGFFNRLWKKAEGGSSGFTPIFLPWWSRPGRDQAWYDRQIADSADPELCKQEYPSNSLEAFLASGRTRFRTEWVSAQAANVLSAIEPRTLPDSLRVIDGVKVYVLPAVTAKGTPRLPNKFLLSADVAEGLEHGDYSSAVLIDLDTGDELASLQGKWEPDEYAGKLAALAGAYDSKIVVERNNHGHAVISKLKTLCPLRIVDGHDEKTGWITNITTKPIAVDALAVALRDGAIRVRTLAALNEMQEYKVLANGKTSAPPGEHDDFVMAWAIALGWKAMVGWKTSGAPSVTGPSRAPTNVLNRPPQPYRPGMPGGPPRRF
jgi:hypothetical protein